MRSRGGVVVNRNRRPVHCLLGGGTCPVHQVRGGRRRPPGGKVLDGIVAESAHQAIKTVACEFQDVMREPVNLLPDAIDGNLGAETPQAVEHLHRELEAGAVPEIGEDRITAGGGDRLRLGLGRLGKRGRGFVEAQVAESLHEDGTDGLQIGEVRAIQDQDTGAGMADNPGQPGQPFIREQVRDFINLARKIIE